MSGMTSPLKRRASGPFKIVCFGLGGRGGPPDGLQVDAGLARPAAVGRRSGRRSPNRASRCITEVEARAFRMVSLRPCLLLSIRASNRS